MLALLAGAVLVACANAAPRDGAAGARANEGGTVLRPAGGGPLADDGGVDATGDGPDLCAAVTCTPLDECHLAGTCDPGTGLCDDPPAPENTLCGDQDGCDVCDGAGTCVPSAMNCPRIVAVAEASPVEGPAPLTVLLSGKRLSHAAAGHVLVWATWEAGDGSPPESVPFASDVPGYLETSHVYALPGGYAATLTIAQDDGKTASGTAFVSVTGTDGAKPPIVTAASAAPLTGNAPLAVTFNAEASDPEGGALTRTWRFGDGTQASTAEATRTYQDPGSYVARFEVTDPQGLRGQSAPIVITVGQGGTLPPRVRAYATPPAGAPPLEAHLLGAADPDVSIAWSWDLGIGGRTASSQEVDVLYELPAIYRATLTATDGQTGLCGSDTVEIVVARGGWPPAVVSLPATRACVGEEYRYQAAARGDRPVSYSLTEAPTLMEVDSASGLVRWTPLPEHVGSQQVTLKVENRQGEDEQQFAIEVTCCTEKACPATPSGESGWGCALAGASGGLSALLALVAMSVVAAIRRRRRGPAGV